MQFSIICVYNNITALEDKLLYSLKKNNVECELVLIDNTNNQFPSAASALNYGANQAKNDVLIFAHQDIYIKSPNEIETMARDIERLPMGSILGAQGAIEGNKEDISNLTAGSELICDHRSEITKLIKCDCVDEGLFGMKRQIFSELRFNEELCNNWHLYAVEMCLHTRKNGGNVYIHPIQIHHFSYGHISRGYMKNMIKLVDYYHNDFKYIWTTCYKVKANRVSIRLLYFIWVLHRLIKGKSLN